ncbi:MAG: STAS domain-containing protein [Campylobacterales bacterium]
MKPAIENEIAVYRIEEDLTPDVGAVFVETLQQHRSILRSLRVRAVLFSLGSINAIDSRAVETVTDALDLLQRQLRVATGFCEYSGKQHVALRHITRERAVFLYKSLKIAELALGVSRLRKNSLLLVFDEESEVKTDIVSELIARGYGAISAMNRADFEKRIKNSASKYAEVVTQSAFGGMLKMVTTGYTKQLFVYGFRGAIDENSHSTFKRQRHLERIGWGYRVFVFDMSKIQMMSARGAYFLYEVARESREREAAIVVVGLDHSRVEEAALRVMEKAQFYFKDTIDEIYSELRLESRLMCNRKIFDESVELTKEMITELPVFLAAVLDAVGSFSGKPCRKEAASRMTLKTPVLRTPRGSRSSPLPAISTAAPFCLFRPKA